MGISNRRKRLTSAAGGPFESLDVTDPSVIEGMSRRCAIDTAYHLAAILSAVGERGPQLAWRVNAGGLQ